MILNKVRTLSLELLGKSFPNNEAQNIQYWSFEIYPLKGLGASATIAGIIGFVIVVFLRFQGKKELLQGIRVRKISNPSLAYIVIIISASPVLFLTFINDLINFLVIYGEVFQIVLFNKIYLDFNFIEGNPYLSHILGTILSSCLGYKFSKELKIFQTNS